MAADRSFVNRKQFPWGFAARSGCALSGCGLCLSIRRINRVAAQSGTTLVAAPLPVARTD